MSTLFLYSYMTPWSVAQPDSATYLRLAEEIQKGHWHIDQWGRGGNSVPPLYSLLVALLEWAIPGFVIAGTLVSILAASASIIPLFLLAKDCYDVKTAWMAIPLTILNPLYLSYVSLPLTESLFTFFFLAGVFLTYRAIKQDSLRLWLFAGIIGGAAWMTRDVGIIIPAVSFLWFAVKIWKDRRLSPGIYKGGIALILGIILVYAPLRIVISLDNKGITHSSTGSIPFQLMAPDLRDSREREIYFGRLTPDGREYAFVEAQKNPPGLMEILRHLDWIGRRFLYNIAEIAMSVYGVMGLFLLIFILSGILRGVGFGGRDPLKFPGPVLFSGSYVLLILFFYALAGGFTGAIMPERYLVSLIPLAGIWASAGIFYAGRWIERFTVKHAGEMAVFLCAGIILTGYAPGIIQIKHVSQTQAMRAEFYERLGKRLRDIAMTSGLNDIVIMDRSPFLSYYAGASWVQMPYGDYPEVLKFARSRDADFIYMEMQLAALRPQLSFLLKSNVSVSEMERVFYLKQRENPEGLSAVMYRIKK